MSNSTISVDREVFHQMMRSLMPEGRHESWPETTRIAVRDTARKLADATAAQTGGNISVDVGAH